ncbi:mannose-6-phosphate isomerase-like protein (cupin superfamily) [Sinorhizobium kostiense]|uniref:Mannose-6-phosphate isomerase-like protein (Cupin superfamily) n=1 Tax=Sinorhizobium kostiense TaxID=76747 RepID=A0ABS4R6J6_9HYPH|nr:cupin domain-containing protein [Sinorhizobium kostiense]MBP2238503.1 mannose-6-phosphate isomerase-like protein (cupin superfamily) [Sinorhizobium kostiense]
MNNEHYPGDAIDWNGVKYSTILSTEATGGKMSIVDSLSPVGSGPPRHVHEREDEIFVIVTGRCKFWLEGEELSRGPGETVFIPRGSEHTFQIVGDVPCRHLVILTPGGFEGFFTEMAAGQYSVATDMPAIMEAAGRHHLRFTGPPLAID